MKKMIKGFQFWSIGLASSWLSLFVLVPSILIFIISFLSTDFEHFARLPLTFSAYGKVFDPLFLVVLGNSLKMALMATLICLLIGYPFAFLITQLPQKLRGLMMFLMILPFWTNSLVRIYAISFFLGKKGLINQSLQWFGLIDQPLNLLYSQFAIVYGLSYLLLPFMVMPLYNALEKLDHSLLEAAKDLGANSFQRFVRVTIPMTMPGIVAGCLMVLLPAMGMFYVADLLGGGKNLLLGNVIRTQFIQTRDWPYGSALSVVMIVLLSLMLWGYLKSSRSVNRKGGLGDSDF